MEKWKMSHFPDNSISRNWNRETSIRTTPQRMTIPVGKFLSKHFSDKRSRQVLIGKTPTRLWFCPQAGLELHSAPGASGTLSGSLLLLPLPVSSAGCCWLVHETPAAQKGSSPWVLETPPTSTSFMMFYLHLIPPKPIQPKGTDEFFTAELWTSAR